MGLPGEGLPIRVVRERDPEPLTIPEREPEREPVTVPAEQPDREPVKV